jgi:hypothetical protein
MKQTFKLLVLMLITSLTSQAQKHQIYNKSFDVNEQTTAIFNLENTTVSIEESTDNKIHLDYTIEFKNYKKKEINKILEAIKAEVNLFENHLTLTTSSNTNVADITFFNTKNGLVIKEEYFKSSNPLGVIVQKSKDSIINKINENPRIDWSKNFSDIFKTIDKKGKERNIRNKNLKMMWTKFTIKIPSYLKLTISGNESQITLRSSFSNELRVILKKGYFKAKQLNNAHNKIKVENADFKVEEIIGGDYTLSNIRTGLIGSIENAKMTSEFSKIEIGEIGENVTITDFNSKLWFYNFSNNFERFVVFSEYSKIYLFYPKTDFSLTTFGHDTVHNSGDFKTVITPNRDNKKSKMMIIGGYEKSNKNEIKIDIVHGIINLAEDSIKKINN